MVKWLNMVAVPCRQMRGVLIVKLKTLLIVLLLLGCQDRHSYELHDGGLIHFNGSDDRWIIINYWAVWCAPCRKEIPELNRFAFDNKSQSILLGVNYDDVAGEELSQQVSDLDIKFANLVQDPRALWNLEKPTVLPETLIIDNNGKLRHRLVGPQTYETLHRILSAEE